MAYSTEEQELLGQLEETYPPSWQFKEAGNETIVGKLVAQRVAMVPDRDTSELQERLIAILESDSGHKATVWMTSVLMSQFSRERVAIGDRVAIKYEGLKSPESGGRDYHNFTVRVKKPEGTTLNWGDPGRSGGRRATDQQLPSHTGPDPDFGGGADDDIPF
jgi:hypothetical protein